VVEHALRKEPDTRPASAAEFAQRLREAELDAGAPVTEVPVAERRPPPGFPSEAELSAATEAVTPASRQPRSSSRRRPRLIAAIAAAVLLVVLAAVVLGSRSTSDGNAGPAGLEEPLDVAVDSGGTVYVADSHHGRVVAVSPDGRVSTLLDGLSSANTIAMWSDDRVVVADAGTGAVVLVSADGTVEPVTVTVNESFFLSVGAIAVDGNTLFLAVGPQVLQVEADGSAEIVAGSGELGFSGDDGPATDAAFDDIYGLAVGPDGSIYISDTGNNRVRRVSDDGTIATFAGTGSPRHSGDGGSAGSAGLANPTSLAFDAAGNLYIAEAASSTVRRVDAEGTITTVAGVVDESGFDGDGGDATTALLNSPEGVAVDADGAIYIADRFNNRVRRIDPDGVITTVA
jgi:sugar lactone lactonase YvrE